MYSIDYFNNSEGQKVFDIEKELKRSGWEVSFEDLLNTQNLKLVDRNNPLYEITIKKITKDYIFEMYFVHYIEGGWQCLDHALVQFKLLEV